jgi:hypothetical protein
MLTTFKDSRPNLINTEKILARWGLFGKFEAELPFQISITNFNFTGLEVGAKAYAW